MSEPYETVSILGHEDVKVRITRRTSSAGIRQHSFQFFRTYKVAGEEKSTMWLNPHHMASIPILLEETKKVIEADAKGDERSTRVSPGGSR